MNGNSQLNVSKRTEHRVCKRMSERANELPKNKCQVKRDTEHTNTHAHFVWRAASMWAGSKCSLQSRAMLPLGLMAHIHTNPFYTWLFVLFFIAMQHSCSPPLPKCRWSPHFSIALFYFPIDDETKNKTLMRKSKVKQKSRKFTHFLCAKLILIHNFLYFSRSLTPFRFVHNNMVLIFWASMMKSHRLLIYDNNKRKNAVVDRVVHNVTAYKNTWTLPAQYERKMI